MSLEMDVGAATTRCHGHACRRVMNISQPSAVD